MLGVRKSKKAASFNMHKDSWKHLITILELDAKSDAISWLKEQLSTILKDSSARQLYLTYSLCATKFSSEPLGEVQTTATGLKEYLLLKKASLLALARIYVLAKVLHENEKHFKEKVQNLIQIADTGELETFLNYLVLLPNPENYLFAGVEALRTNIATVFDAIALKNPYPARYFNDQQWNQMYLKAAFMQRNLGDIEAVDDRANKDLTRIISDYAHERWAAYRTIDPEFWRPVSNFLEGVLIDDITRLLKSKDAIEVKAATLVCYHSHLPIAEKLLQLQPKYAEAVANGAVTWKNLKD